MPTPPPDRFKQQLLETIRDEVDRQLAPYLRALEAFAAFADGTRALPAPAEPPAPLAPPPPRVVEVQKLKAYAPREIRRRPPPSEQLSPAVPAAPVAPVIRRRSPPALVNEVVEAAAAPRAQPSDGPGAPAEQTPMSEVKPVPDDAAV